MAVHDTAQNIYKHACLCDLAIKVKPRLSLSNLTTHAYHDVDPYRGRGRRVY